MRYWKRKRTFIHNEQAVSEEFTVVPALSMVMIGLTIFIILLAQTYNAYAYRIKQLQCYQTADNLIHKITNPGCYFIKTGGLLDLSRLENDRVSFQRIYEQYQKAGYFLYLELCWDGQIITFPEFTKSPYSNQIAVSKELGVYLNEAQTVPGILTVVLGRK